VRRLRSLLAALLLLVVLPGQTRAQTMVTPFVGAAFDKDTHDGARSVYGIAGGYWPAGPIGLEVEYAYHPDFFPPHHPDGDHHVVGHLETLSVNLAVGAPSYVSPLNPPRDGRHRVAILNTGGPAATTLLTRACLEARRL
jgi:hypothetical protein